MEEFLGGLLFGLLLGLLGVALLAKGRWALSKEIKGLNDAMVRINASHAETVRLRDEEIAKQKAIADGVRTRLKSLEASSKGGAAAKLEMLETALRIATERYPDLARVLPEAVEKAQSEMSEVESGQRRFLPFKLSALRLTGRKTGSPETIDAEVDGGETDPQEG
jgi:hypothetical protein